MTDHRCETSTAEIAALTARLRAPSAAGAAAEPAERERFLADKQALLARLAVAGADTGHTAGEEDTLDRHGPAERGGISGSGQAECGDLAARLATVRARLLAEDTDSDCRLAASPDHGLDDADTAGWAR